MPKKPNNKNATRRSPRVEALSKGEKELTAEEMKLVKGGEDVAVEDPKEIDPTQTNDAGEAPNPIYMKYGRPRRE